MSAKVLIVEDEADMVELLQFNLGMEGYDIHAENNGRSAQAYLSENHVDLILLDLMIPELDGMSLCRWIRQSDEIANIPIIMITAKSQEHHIITGLEAGANDYIVKPFSIGVLVARVRRILQSFSDTVTKKKDETLSIGLLSIYPNEYKVQVQHKDIPMKSAEFRLLLCLAEKPGWVFSREQLIEASKGENHIITDRSIDVMMVALRKKLGPAAAYLETVRGVGYRLSKPQDS